MSNKACFCGKAFLSEPAKVTFGANKDVNSWIKFRLYNTSFCASEKLVPWERTPWHWSKHLKFRPSWIMTVPQRLSFFEQLSNCNLATCWHIGLSILGLRLLSISIHLRIRFGCSMKFFQLKITLGLALGRCLRNHRTTLMSTKACSVGRLPRQTCKNYLGQKQGCKLMAQI